jgi:tripartite-type tricarboxylate transporter receptor subunit TctC
MNRIASNLLWIVCSAVAMPAGAAGAEALRDYPAKPIRMVVPFPPGAASDFLARTVGQKLADAYGQQVVVDNRPGGGGVVGSVVVARAAPDGYTLSLIGTPHIVNALLAAEPQYRPLEDYTPITQVASLPNLLVVSPGAPVSSVQELIALAKSRPGQLNFGSAGIGSLSHMAGELFKQAAGIDTVHIPFKLLSDAVTEMMAGRVHYYVFPVTAAVPLLKEGRLRPLAVTIDKRLESLPNVPTMAEAGLPSFRFDGWFGVAAPAKLPLPLVARLNADIVRILRQPDTRERFVRQGAEPVFGSPEEFKALMQAEYVRFQKVIRDSGIKVQ